MSHKKLQVFLTLLVILLPTFASRGQENPWPIKLQNVPKEDAIDFCLYTTANDTLKLTAQLYPLADDVDRAVKLQIRKGSEWIEVAATKVSEEPMGFPQQALKRWTAHFRVSKWDMTKDYDYRIVAAGGAATYEGKIRRDPVDKAVIVVAAFTGNSSRDRRLKPDLIANIKAQDPDLLFFSGDQSYDHRLHYQAWLLFGKQFGEIMKDRPTICIPDDHDVGQANIWGENGVVEGKSEAGSEGGFFFSPQYVNSVQNAQCWHLPDPYDPTPIKRDIGVYYTNLNIGRVGFAVIEDRKFKTGPGGFVPQMGPRPDHITDPNYDRQAIDLPDARLLGERQLKFLREWGQDWRGHDIKAVLSQTVFANAAHLHGKYNYRLIADLDSNGWPQSGRNRALQEIRRFHGFMIGGDQHLATVIHHGINSFGDAGYSFCVPSIVNFYNRWWVPDEKPVRKIEGALPFLGDYYEGFGNKVTMHAYANPDEARKNKYGGEWGERADGYGIIRFNITTRKITMECWPRGVDVTRADAEQYPGWPVTINQTDNYGRQGMAWLPTLRIKGMTDPVVQIIDETYGDLVYSLRITGTTFRPKVFRDGHYTIKIGQQPDRMKTLAGIEAKPKNETTLDVVFD